MIKKWTSSKASGNFLHQRVDVYVNVVSARLFLHTFGGIMMANSLLVGALCRNQNRQGLTKIKKNGWWHGGEHFSAKKMTFFVQLGLAWCPHPENRAMWASLTQGLTPRSGLKMARLVVVAKTVLRKIARLLHLIPRTQDSIILSLLCAYLRSTKFYWNPLHHFTSPTASVQRRSLHSTPSAGLGVFASMHITWAIKFIACMWSSHL